MPKIIDLTRLRFGRLTVIKFAYIKTYKFWLCKCDCGNETIVRAGHLTSGRTFSCGCTKKENMAVLRYKHGRTKERCFKLYKSMKNRCRDLNAECYKNYGGRGITVCDEWLNDYTKFREWSYANGYKEELLPNGKNKWTIDRIDVNGNYEPDNCRFVTMAEQAKNKRNSK